MARQGKGVRLDLTSARIKGPEISWQLTVSLYVNGYSLFGKFASMSRRNDSYDFNAFDDLTG
jgi:hypothetical protein